jgi:uncharacterized protein (TIGR04168 family)
MNDIATISSGSCRIAIIGDIHSQWSLTDNQLLPKLAVDLVLFVGDFGNEDVSIAKIVSELELPKAVILGNHDAWFSATDWGRSQCPYDRSQEDWVQAQIELLGDSYVGYGQCSFPQFNLAVVGGRPFSWGGDQWRNQKFYQSRFGINSFAESTAKIVAAADSTNAKQLIFIGHNGPTGLGDQPEDMCGRDWTPVGGDFGDPDLAAAIEQLQSQGRSIPLVTFGHMHHQLRHRTDRLRVPARQIGDTLYLNAARCPRMVSYPPILHNFSIVTLQDGQVTEASLIWVDRQGEIQRSEDYLRTINPVIQ